MSGNLLTNGDFSQGVYTSAAKHVEYRSGVYVNWSNSSVPIGWTPNPGFDDPSFNYVVVNPNTGYYELLMGNNVFEPLSSLSQTFKDTPGVVYTFSFDLYAVKTTGSLQVAIDSTTEMTIIGTDNGPTSYVTLFANGVSSLTQETLPYTTQTFSFVGTGKDTLTFSGANNLNSYGMSNVVIEHVPTSYAWVGGGTNSITNTKDLSQSGVIASGDSITMNGGTMNIAKYALPLDTNLEAYGNDLLNISGGSSFSAYVYGTTTADLSGTDTLCLTAANGGTATINNSGTLIGTISADQGSASINGGSFQNGFARDNAGYSYTADDGSLLVNAKVIGQGNFDNYGGTMEFVKAVGSGQTVSVLSASGASLVRLDAPTQFAGTIDLTEGAIDLVGLGNVGSFTFAHDLLTLFVGKKAVDTLALNATGFSVERSGSDVYVYAGVNPIKGATSITGTFLS